MKLFLLIFTVGIFNYSFASSEKREQIHISGKLLNTLPGDTIEIYLLAQVYEFNAGGDLNITTVNNNGIFKFNSNISEPTYIRILKKKNDDIFPVLKDYIILPGDNIFIKETNNELLFMGNGSNRFKIFQKTSKEDEKFILFNQSFIENAKGLSRAEFAENIYQLGLPVVKSRTLLKLKILDSFKLNINKSEFNLLYTDFRYEGKSTALSYLNSALVEPLIGESRKLLLIQNYMNAFRDLEFDDTSNSKLIYSLQFKRYAINHARLELFKNKEQLRGRSLYYQLKKDYQGTLRECVISYVISTNRTAYIPDTSYKSDALSFFKDKRFIKIIRKFYPDNSNYSIFNEPLINKEGKLITLSEFKGKIILIDFWFTGCTGCKQMKPYLDKIDSTFKENNNVVLISISVDQNNDTWLKSVNKKIYSSTNAEPFRVDADHPSIIKRFNVASYPQMLLVAKSGSVTVPEDPRNDNSKKLIEKIYGMDAR